MELTNIKESLKWLRNENDVIISDKRMAILEAKRTIKTPLQGVKEPMWKNYESCCKLMEERGVLATKLNYSNLNRQEVRVTLTHDRRSLTFETLETKGCLSSIFGREKRSYPLSSFVGAFYGGTTSTFKLHLKHITRTFCKKKK